MSALKITMMFLMTMATGYAEAKTSVMSRINLGYGKLDLGAGGGSIIATVDSQNKLQEISVKIHATFFGMKQNLTFSQSIQQLSKGEAIKFFMEGSKLALMIVKPLQGFNVNGGKLKISILHEDGYRSSIVELNKGAYSKDFYMWKGDDKITNFEINLRGYSIAELVVGWYELVTN